MHTLTHSTNPVKVPRLNTIEAELCERSGNLQRTRPSSLLHTVKLEKNNALGTIAVRLTTTALFKASANHGRAAGEVPQKFSA